MALTVAKFLNHAAVDYLYGKALGANVTFLNVEGKGWRPADWRRDGLNIVRVNNPRKLTLAVDIFVIDDYKMLEVLKLSNVKYGKLVWHCHGLHDQDTPRAEQVRDFLRRDMKGLPVIFEDRVMRDTVTAWRCETTESMVVGRAITDQHFWCEKERNGRAMLLGNRVLEAFKLREHFEVSFRIWMELMERLPLEFDVYGYNSTVPVRHRRGFNPYITELRWYSVGCFPSMVTRCSYSMLETMAMSIPCVMPQQKENLPDNMSGKAWVMAIDPEDFVDEAQSLMKDEARAVEMGKAGQEWALRTFGFNAWKDRLMGFLSRL